MHRMMLLLLLHLTAMEATMRGTTPALVPLHPRQHPSEPSSPLRRCQLAPHHLCSQTAQLLTQQCRCQSVQAAR